MARKTIAIGIEVKGKGGKMCSVNCPLLQCLLGKCAKFGPLSTSQNGEDFIRSSKCKEVEI